MQDFFSASEIMQTTRGSAAAKSGAQGSFAPKNIGAKDPSNYVKKVTFFLDLLVIVPHFFQFFHINRQIITFNLDLGPVGQQCCHKFSIRLQHQFK